MSRTLTELLEGWKDDPSIPAGPETFGSMELGFLILPSDDSGPADRYRVTVITSATHSPLVSRDKTPFERVDVPWLGVEPAMRELRALIDAELVYLEARRTKKRRRPGAKR